MIDRSHDLPVARQALALGISRGSVYYLPRPVAASARRHAPDRRTAPELPVRRQPDAARPAGWRRLRVGRLHVATLMKRMGIEAPYRRPSTSKPAPRHKIYPYLLRKWRSHGPTRCGPWTSRISRWRAASCIWRPLSTGSAAGFWHGGCRSRWSRRSASRRWRKLCRVTAHRRSSTHRRAARQGDRDQHGRQRGVA